MSKSGKIRSRRKEHGQSVVEVALTLPFLLIIILALVEMGIVFASYVALVNATRNGAVYASMHPELADAVKTPVGGPIYEEYQTRVYNEISVAVGEKLREGQLVDTQTLTVDRPVVGPTCMPRCVITSTVHYQIHTLFSDASLPGFGRLGLPNYYQINYSMQMPFSPQQ